MNELVSVLKEAGASPIVITLAVLAFIILTTSPIRGPLGAAFRTLFGRAERRAEFTEAERLRDRDREQAELEDARRNRDYFRDQLRELRARWEPREKYLGIDSAWHADVAINSPELARQLPPHLTLSEWLAEQEADKARMRIYHGEYATDQQTEE